RAQLALTQSLSAIADPRIAGRRRGGANGRVRPDPLPPLSPARSIGARLDDGRGATFTSDVARRAALARLPPVSGVNQQRAFDAIDRLNTTTTAHATAQKELAERVAAVEKRNDEALLHLFEALRGISGRVQATVKAQQAAQANVQRSTQAIVAKSE